MFRLPLLTRGAAMLPRRRRRPRVRSCNDDDDDAASAAASCRWLACAAAGARVAARPLQERAARCGRSCGRRRRHAARRSAARASARVCAAGAGRAELARAVGVRAASRRPRLRTLCPLRVNAIPAARRLQCVRVLLLPPRSLKRRERGARRMRPPAAPLCGAVSAWSWLCAPSSHSAPSPLRPASPSPSACSGGRTRTRCARLRRA